VRRVVALVLALAALTGASTASASLIPLRRHFGDVTIPRFRHGHIVVPAGHSSGTVRMIATLPLAPLAQAFGNATNNRFGGRQLDAALPSARAYLARLDAAQSQAIAQIRRAIPQAKISWRYRIVLDGFTVSLPETKLPKLLGLGFLSHVYPSVRYTLALNKSPSIIGATQLEQATGASGAGIKIGVVDDGIDQTNQFFNPSGFSYPAGFPKGNTSFTTPKVIVARAFPGPGSGPGGQLPLDRQASFHGTHVAGIAAGDATTRPSPACPESHREPGSATTASSTSRRRSSAATSRRRRRSSPPSRARSPTG
jgi:hypothetical protein